MSSKSLFFSPIFLFFYILLFILFHVHNAFSPIKEAPKKKKSNQLFSSFKSGYAHLSSWYGYHTDSVLPSTIRWLIYICGLSFSFSSFLILLGSWWPENSWHALQRRHFSYFKTKPNPATILPKSWLFFSDCICIFWSKIFFALCPYLWSN